MDSTRKVISSILDTEKGTSVDSRISYRHILSILTDKVKKFIKQDADGRRLFKVSDVWKRIPCLSLKEINLLECGFDIPQCNKLMKSVEKVPEVFQSGYGDMLKVLTITGDKEFHQTTFSAYKDIRNREYVDPNTRYFIVLDNHIYVPDSEVEELMILGLFKHPFEVTKLTDPENGKCLKPLDEPFPCPDYLLDPVKSDTKLELAKIYRALVKDEKANDNEIEK